MDPTIRLTHCHKMSRLPIAARPTASEAMYMFWIPFADPDTLTLRKSLVSWVPAENWVRMLSSSKYCRDWRLTTKCDPSLNVEKNQEIASQSKSISYCASAQTVPESSSNWPAVSAEECRDGRVSRSPADNLVASSPGPSFVVSCCSSSSVA